MNERPWQRHYDQSVPNTLRYMQIPAYQLLDLPAGTYPDKAAYNFYGTEMTFWDLRMNVRRMANALIKLGIKKGDRVGIHLPNCPQFMIAYFATLSVGAIIVNLNPMYTATELISLSKNTELTALFTFDMFMDNVKALCKDVDIPTVILTRVTDYINGLPRSTAEEMNLEKKWHHFSLLLDSSTDTSCSRVEILPEDPALIQFTGGTTGIPKGAVLTNGNLVAATIQCTAWGSSSNAYIPYQNIKTLSIMPFFHIYGAIVALNWSVLNCSTQILIPRFEIDEFMELISKFERITFFPAVPTIINAVLNHPGAEELELGKKLGLLNSGGAPIALELIHQAMDMGITISEGWGMSETTSLGIANPVMGLKKPGSIGIPWPDTDIRIVDIADGETEVPMGEPGELLIKSPLVMKEYWNNPEETAGQLKDGWLSTGDIVTMDQDYYISVVDRKKDMIIAGGYNIYPREIDEVLFQHPAVKEAIAIGIPDDYRGETIKAYIVTKEGKTLTEKEMLDFCKTKLAPYKMPKIVEFRKELPKSAVGKILRKILRDEEIEKGKNN